MKKKIIVYADDSDLDISTNGDGYYTIKLDNDRFIDHLTEKELQELKYMIDEITQHSNKKDW